MRLVTTIASGWTPTARTSASRHAERLDFLGRLLLTGLELLAVAVDPDDRDLELQAGLDVGLVARRDVDPSALAADPPLALLEVGWIGLVGAHLLRRDHEVEVGAEVPAGGTEQLVVDVRQDPDLELLGEPLELGVGLAERWPSRHARGQEARARRLQIPSELARDADGGTAQHLGVELVGAVLDLPRNVQEEWAEGVLVDRETVAVRLLLKRVVGARFPVDQRPVAVERDKANLLG